MGVPTGDGPQGQWAGAVATDAGPYRATDAALLIVRADHERAVRDRLTAAERENVELKAANAELRTRLHHLGVEGF